MAKSSKLGAAGFVPVEETAPSRGRGRPTGSNEDGGNKSAFIREQLSGNPKMTAKEVSQAWSEAGNPGSIAFGLYYTVRGKQKTSRPGRPKKTSAPAENPVEGKSKSSVEEYLSIEMELDGMLARVVNSKDRELKDALHRARRRVSSEILRLGS